MNRSRFHSVCEDFISTTEQLLDTDNLYLFFINTTLTIPFVFFLVKMSKKMHLGQKYFVNELN